MPALNQAFMTQRVSADERANLFEQLVDTCPGAVLKGAAMPYTSVNGNMYSYLSKDGFLALRLPEKAREEFLKKYKTTLVTAYGILQKEYVVVPDTLLQKQEMKLYFAASFAYASGLKPKPSKKKK
jgi:hypothetical protein